MPTRDEIKEARRLLGESQAAFAKRLGVNQATVHRWETKGVTGRGTAQVAVDNLLKDLAGHQSEAAQ